MAAVARLWFLHFCFVSSFLFFFRSSCQVTDCALEALSVHCPSLEWLDLSWCGGVTDQGFVRLAEGCLSLEEVRACVVFFLALVTPRPPPRGTCHAIVRLTY